MTGVQTCALPILLVNPSQPVRFFWRLVPPPLAYPPCILLSAQPLNRGALAPGPWPTEETRVEGPRIRGELRPPVRVSCRGREAFEVSRSVPDAGRSEESEAQVEAWGRASHPLLEAVLTPWLHPGTGPQQWPSGHPRIASLRSEEHSLNSSH